MTNPILDADFPDLDAIRVDDRYILTVSSFNRSPGLPVLVSHDLADWRIVSRAATTVEPADHFRLPRHGAGIWAPSIRHHDGRFWIFAPDPDRGIWVYRADAPEGPWDAPTLLMEAAGVIDPCPLWDDDGRAWMVFGWARSRAGWANRISAVEISPDATRVIGEPFTVIDGDALEGYHTLEGPKIYKRDGTYWIFAPAGGVGAGWQSVFRADSLAGPYESRIVLSQGDSEVNGPHQGAWVTTPDGEDWFLHFQERHPFGRVVHAQPMRWTAEGWPELGEGGTPVAVPSLPGTRRRRWPLGDDWSGERPGLQWAWQANERSEWGRVAEGRLQLRALATDAGSLRTIPQVLGQPLADAASARCSLSVADLEPGARAGMVVLGERWMWAGLRVRPDGAVAAVIATSDGGEEVEVAEMPSSGTVDLELAWTRLGDVTATVVDGANRLTTAQPWRAAPARWVSAELGLFAASPLGSRGSTTATFGRFEIRHEQS